VQDTVGCQEAIHAKGVERRHLHAPAAAPSSPAFRKEEIKSSGEFLARNHSYSTGIDQVKLPSYAGKAVMNRVICFTTQNLLSHWRTPNPAWVCKP
jgi:hypothetical protein